jgi:tetratricopeptide (TPR) repeat protein
MEAIYSQMQVLYLQLQLWDQALAAGDKLLAMDPDDLDATRKNVAATEGKKDIELAAKWRQRLTQLESQVTEVRSGLITQVLDDESAGKEVSNSPLRPLVGRQRQRFEAALFAEIRQERDAKHRLDLLRRFYRDFPFSRHFATVVTLFVSTYREIDDEKALPIAEIIAEHDRSRVDTLFYVAQQYFGSNREPDKTVAYCKAVDEQMATAVKPADVNDELWQERQKMMLFHCRRIAGTIRIRQNQWVEADKFLRAALPLAEEDNEARANILSSLGLINYNLRNIEDAVKFYQNCTDFDSSLKAAAEERVRAIKAEFRLH